MASFQAIPKAKDLLDYTMERTTAKEAAGSTKPRFPKSQSFGYCKALRDAALSILERIQAANDYYFETQFEERLIALDEVLQKCGLMLHLIDLSLKRGYITGDQAHYWTEMVLSVKRPVFFCGARMTATAPQRCGQKSRRLKRRRWLKSCARL